MANELLGWDVFLRAVLFVVGLLIAGHHFAASNALQRAPVYVKVLLMPCTVGSGVGMAWAAAFSGSGLALIFALPVVVCLVTKDLVIWRSGAFISTAFDRIEAEKSKGGKCP